jgi:hypothetical protein
VLVFLEPGTRHQARAGGRQPLAHGLAALAPGRALGRRASSTLLARDTRRGQRAGPA